MESWDWAKAFALIITELTAGKKASIHKFAKNSHLQLTSAKQWPTSLMGLQHIKWHNHLHGERKCGHSTFLDFKANKEAMGWVHVKMQDSHKVGKEVEHI